MSERATIQAETENAAPPTPVPFQRTVRRAALEPYWSAIRAHRVGSAPPLPLESGARELQLTAGEWNMLNRDLAGNPEDECDWSWIVSEAVALQAKVIDDVDRLENAAETPEPADAAELTEALVNDAAMGFALVTESRRMMQDMIRAGKAADARKLTGFLTKLERTIGRIRQRLDDESCREAMARSERLIPTEAERRAAAAATVVDDTERPSQTAFARTRANGQIIHGKVSHGPSKALFATLAASIVLGLFILGPKLTRKPLPTLTQVDVATSDAVENVVARPPSLFVEVDAERWGAMTERERLDLVDQVGDKALASGYTGAQFRMPDGTSVAVWLKARGSSLLSIDRPRS